MDIQPMNSIEHLEEILKELLPRLYDSNYILPLQSVEYLGLPHEGGAALFSDIVIATLQRLEPAPETPRNSRSWRLYSILALRYLQHLTQQAVAEQIGISVRHLSREQSQAIHHLAQRVWETSDHCRNWVCASEADLISAVTPLASDVLRAEMWRLQVARELTSLQNHSPGTRTNVSRVIEQTAQVMCGPLSKWGITVSVGRMESDVVSVAHPSVVSQIIVSTITYVAGQMKVGRIELAAARSEARISVTILGTPIPQPVAAQQPFVSDLVTLAGGEVDCYPEAGGLCVCISLPLIEDVVVLVIDDNEDLRRFYDGCVTGTQFRIVGIGEGRQAFDCINAVRPDIVVLDVMLPDKSGWELLVQLHEHPVSRHIPVVVCSVVREEELALALGASVCIAKPVRRHQFVQALERAFSRAVSEASRGFHSSP